MIPNDATVPSIVVNVNTGDGIAVLQVGGNVTFDQSATLTIQLVTPLPSGSVIPILDAGQINGGFTTIIVKDVPSRNCKASGVEQKTQTSLSILMYASSLELMYFVRPCSFR